MFFFNTVFLDSVVVANFNESGSRLSGFWAAWSTTPTQPPILRLISESSDDLRSTVSRSSSLMVREQNRGRLVLQAIVFWVIAPAIALSLLM